MNKTKNSFGPIQITITAASGVYGKTFTQLILKKTFDQLGCNVLCSDSGNNVSPLQWQDKIGKLYSEKRELDVVPFDVVIDTINS